MWKIFYIFIFKLEKCFALYVKKMCWKMLISD